MVVDFKRLKEIVKGRIIRVLDHQNLNDLTKVGIPTWDRMIDFPTAENMVLFIKESLEEVFSYNLVRVKLYETEDCFAEWERDEK